MVEWLSLSDEDRLISIQQKPDGYNIVVFFRVSILNLIMILFRFVLLRKNEC
jgi:hypothetical protein